MIKDDVSISHIMTKVRVQCTNGKLALPEQRCKGSDSQGLSRSLRWQTSWRPSPCHRKRLLSIIVILDNGRDNDTDKTSACTSEEQTSLWTSPFPQHKPKFEVTWQRKKVISWFVENIKPLPFYPKVRHPYPLAGIRKKKTNQYMFKAKKECLSHGESSIW